MNIFEAGPRVMARLHDETARLYRQFDGDPLPGSHAGVELLPESGRSIVQTAYSQGAMLLEVTADQVAACRRTLTSPIMTVAPWTAARSAMESCALGCWLMDSAITRTERMARSFAFRYEGLRQQEKLLRAVGAEDKGTADALGRRIETVEQSALELGFMPLRGKRNQIIGIGCVMPSITDLAATVLNREEEYRLFSAVAHAHFWALNQLSLYACDPPVDAEKGTRNFVHGSGYLEKHLSATSTMFVVSEVLDYLSRIVWARFALFGWAIDDLRRTLEEIYDAIGLSISPRFWRKNV